MTDSLQISPPTLADAEELLAFEVANRDYVEQSVTARNPAYYSIDGVGKAIAQAQQNRLEDVAYQFLVKAGDNIVGRVNLTGIIRPYFNKAMLGYRIGQQSAGCGYASKAVELALQQAFGDLGLWRIEATSQPQNLASVRILERNGFTVYGRSEKAMRFHNAWSDLLHFERRCDNLPE